MSDHKSVKVLMRGDAIHARISADPPKPFHISTNNLRGLYAHSTIATPRGNWLPEWAASAIRSDFALARDEGVKFLFVVYSFQTPIAWRTHDGIWRIPDVRYSVRTSRHQGLIRYAVTRTGE